jgi:ribosomal protein S11
MKDVKDNINYVKVFINASRTNVFITVTDKSEKPFWILSGGCMRVRAKANNWNKRYKSAPGTLLNLGKHTAAFLINLNPTFIHLVMKVALRHRLRAILNELKAAGITINILESRIPFIFSRVRAKKKRRV